MSKSVDNGKHQPVGNNGSLADLRMIGPGELAQRMCVSRRQIFRWRAAGKLPPYDFSEGQTKRWQVTTVIAWIQQKKAS